MSINLCPLKIAGTSRLHRERLFLGSGQGVWGVGRVQRRGSGRMGLEEVGGVVCARRAGGKRVGLMLA